MKPTLYMLVGIPGCGKTTWATNFIKEHRDIEDIRYVSRDEIRFELVDPQERYFSHEKEVFKRFVGTIAQTLIDGFDVIADATHISIKSRKKLLAGIDNFGFLDYSIIFIYFNTSYAICCGRNSQRTDRALVPQSTMESMYKNFRKPSMLEDERCIGLWLMKGIT